MLAVPAGFDAPRLLRYDDVTAHAITRDDLGADVRGIDASLDLTRETRGGTWPTGPVTEEEGLRRPGPARVRVPGRQVIHVLRRGRGGGYIACAYLLPSGAQHRPFQPLNHQQGAGCSEILDAPPSDHEITRQRQRRPQVRLAARPSRADRRALSLAGTSRYGAAKESNLPTAGLRRPAGFEDRACARGIWLYRSKLEAASPGAGKLSGKFGRGTPGLSSGRRPAAAGSGVDWRRSASVERSG